MLRIRRGEASDLPALLDTLTRCVFLLRKQGIRQWDDRYPGPGRFSKDISLGTLSIAEVQGVVAAAVVLDTEQYAEYGQVNWQCGHGTAGVVHRLMVRPEFQHQGLARRMMKHAEAEAGRAGFSSIRLDAFTKNPAALRLYEQLEYLRVGTVRFRQGEFVCFEKGLSVDGTGRIA